MTSQVDRCAQHLEAIIDYKRDNTALGRKHKYIVTRSGRPGLRKTTARCKFLVRRKNGIEEWIALRLLKKSYPVDVADFAKSRSIHDKTAFFWWVPFTLRKRDCIVSSMKINVKKITHKYGIEVPTSLAHAKTIDERNNNALWSDASYKEMANVAIAFQVLETDDPIPVGWTMSSGHIVFDMKMDFTRKAIWVKDGHRTPDPKNSTFAGVVSRESVRIASTYAALNKLDICVADMKNAYLQAPSSEKHYIICGPEFKI